MREWLKMLAGSICVLTILLNLIPNGKFTKYVRFYAGLLFFLMAASPILHLLGSEGDLEQLLQIEFLREDYYDLETAVAGMSELKNEQIHAACQQEIRRQIGAIVSAYGIANADVEISFASDSYSPDYICVSVKRENGTSSPESRAHSGQMPEQTVSVAAKKIRSEIAAVYGVEQNRISITLEGGHPL